MHVVLYPDPVLLRPAEPIEEITDDLRHRIEQMEEVMALENGVGLAAPQVGWGVRLLLASEDGQPETTQALINPRVVSRSGTTEWGEEGCLSFPGIYGEVLRDLAVKVEALDLNGAVFEIEAQGFFARVIQHEIDHLDGIPFISKMRPANKAENKAAIDELIERYNKRQLHDQGQLYDKGQLGSSRD